MGLAADWVERDLERGFAETVHPFLDAYCFGCHGAEKQKGKLDLRPYSTLETVANDYRRWEMVLENSRPRRCRPKKPKASPRRIRASV